MKSKNKSNLIAIFFAGFAYLPTDVKIYDSVDDYKRGEVIQPSYCRKCGGTKYVLKHYEEEHADQLICARCGNNTWN